MVLRDPPAWSGHFDDGTLHSRAFITGVGLVPACVEGGKWAGCQAVGEDGESDGEVDGDPDQVRGRLDAGPRGPNQPRNPSVGRRAWVPHIAIATGIMRTSVRLSTA